MPTVRSGYPTRPRMPTPEIRLRRAAAAAEEAQVDADLAASAAAEAQTDADQALLDAAAADGRVTNVVGGVEPFTALNVGGTNVKPFLDKTDGAKLTDAAGLNDGLVVTEKVAPEAVTVDGLASTDARITLNNTSLVDIQSVVMTTTGQPVTINWSLYLRSKNASGYNVLVFLSRSTDPGGGAPLDTATPDACTYQALELTGDDLLYGFLGNQVEDTPPAGTTTYILSVRFDQTGLSVQTAEKRVIHAREFKR